MYIPIGLYKPMVPGVLANGGEFGAEYRCQT